MSEQRTIELTDLYLDFNGSKFPILALNLEYYLGNPPAVEVTISSAINIDGTDSSLDLLDDNVGNLASVCMHLNYHADTDESHPGESHEKQLTLFCGYIIVSQPTFVCNAVSIASTKTLRLVAAVEGLDGTPLGVLSYWPAESFTRGSHPLSYAQINELYKAWAQFEIEPTDFNKNAGAFLVRFMSAERRLVEHLFVNRQKGIHPFRLEQTIKPIPAQPTIKIKEKTNGLNLVLHRYISGLFNNSSPTAVISNVAHQFFLEWMPATMGTFGKKEPCQMLLLPVNAWDSDVCFTIEPGDLLDVRGTTNFRINSTIDCWAVSYNPAGAKLHGRSPIAVYGPLWHTASGEAIVLDSLEAMREAARKGKEAANAAKEKGVKGVAPIFYLSTRNVSLPFWMSMQSLRAYGETAATGGTSSSPELAVVTNQEQASADVRDWAKVVAKQVFLIEGLSGKTARARIPLWRWLTLLPYLGRVGQLNILSTDSSKRSVNAVDLETEPYYGILSGLALTIQLDNKNISCQCSMQMSSIRDETLQGDMACENAFYKWDSAALESELGDAVALSEDLLTLEHKSWGSKSGKRQAQNEPAAEDDTYHPDEYSSPGEEGRE